MKDGTPDALTFGIYPGSAVGDTGPAGPPDRPDKINQALAQLQGSPGAPAATGCLAVVRTERGRFMPGPGSGPASGSRPARGR